MKAQKQLIFYHSILDVLSETGCPFCRFLKEYQAVRIQSRRDQSFSHLCSFHTWALAAVQDALITARIFIDLLEEITPASDGASDCDICSDIAVEEDRRIRELSGCIHRTDISNWLHTDAVLCVPHGIKLRRYVQPAVAARIDTILESHRRQLVQELETLCGRPQAGKPGWGSLGRTAEFLVSQRGLHS